MSTQIIRSTVEQPYSVHLDNSRSVRDPAIPPAQSSLSKLSTGLRTAFKAYTCYYVVSLLINASVLALYAVQAFSFHQPCLSKQGHNITKAFEHLFQLGFAINFAEAFLANLLNTHLRFQVQKEEKTYGVVSKGTRRLAVGCTYTEWACRAMLLGLSVLQSILITSPKGDYCMHTLKALTLEGYWMVALVAM